MERVEGIEPSWPAWKAGTLPLSYTRGDSLELVTVVQEKVNADEDALAIAPQLASPFGGVAIPQ